jgi:hypothetical protein
MRPPGIEPGLEAWEATVIPLDHGRKIVFLDSSYVTLLHINSYAFKTVFCLMSIYL